MSEVEQWASAYDELHREYLKLSHRLYHAEFDARIQADLLRLLEPYLPEEFHQKYPDCPF